MKTFQLLKVSTLTTLTLVALAGSYQAMAFDTDEVKDGQVAYADEFKLLDKDHNGVINWTETKTDKSVSHAAFLKADADNDGTLDNQEYAEIKTELGQNKVAQVTSDSVITTKAKAKLLAENELKSFKISVETYKGEVILSGFVNSAAMKEKAGQIVSQIEGVKSVTNSLVVKS